MIMLHKMALGAAAIFTLTIFPALAQEPLQKADFVNAAGENLGTATFSEGPGGVLIHLDLKNLTPGTHAFHVHEKGNCDGTNGFKGAGEHLAMPGHEHGFMTEKGPHEGDMPNLFVSADGTLQTDIINSHITLSGAKDRAILNDDDGAALIIHANADDYKSQPSGNAGDRVACAVVK